MITALLMGRRGSGPSAHSLFFPWLRTFAESAGMRHVVYGTTATKIDLASVPLGVTSPENFESFDAVDSVVFSRHPTAHYEVVQTGLSIIGAFDGALPPNILEGLRDVPITGTLDTVTDDLSVPVLLSRITQLSSASDGNYPQRVARVLSEHLTAGSYASFNLMMGAKPTAVLTHKNYPVHAYVVSHHRSFYLVLSTVTLPTEIVSSDMRLYRWPISPTEHGACTTTFNLQSLRSRWLRWTDGIQSAEHCTPHASDPMRYARALTFLNDWLLNHSH